MAYVLLVEDDWQLRRLLAEFLGAIGYHVESACNGAEALDLLRQHCPDAVVVDLQMPVLDGWSVVRTCRKAPELAEVPVVVMSAMDNAREMVAPFGVRACLSKPFDLDELADALEGIGVDAGASGSRQCTYCGAERMLREVRVFARDQGDYRWDLCDRCWTCLLKGFQAHRPGEDLQQRLAGTVRIHAAEARGWITTGVAQLGTRR